MKKLQTTITALITPFLNQEVDYNSLDNLVRFQLQGGIGGFVINGTTAESPTLESDEVKNIFKFVRNIVGPDFPLIVGTGSNSTLKTIKESIVAKELGADAILVVVPYYNKPPQRGLIQHFSLVAQQSQIPTMLYNVPGRTVTSMNLDTIVELSKVKNIIGIKEASGNIQFASEIYQKCSKDFILLSGDDGTYIDFLKNGGQGVISVASHIIPKQFVNWLKNPSKAEDFNLYKNLIDLLFIEANPIPVKKALQYLGIIRSAELRLPLVEMESALGAKLKTEMMRTGLIQ